MTEKQPKAEYLLLLIPVFMAGAVGVFLGFVNHNPNPLSGFLWGIGAGFVILIICGIGFFGWEQIKKEASKGKLLPYMIMGFLAAVVISGLLAINLGKPSCDEHADAPYSGNCISYTNNGFEATTAQRWKKFWEILPVTVIVCLLIAYVVRNQVEKERPKHFK